MSFGFGVGDFITVAEVSWRLYRACKGLSGEFQELSREALTIHTVVKELQDETGNEKSILNSYGASKKEELATLIKNLEEALLEADNVVGKHQRPGRTAGRIRNPLRFASKDLEPIRNKLNLHLSAINAFTASLSLGTLSRIEWTIRDLVDKARSGRRPPSILSNDDKNKSSVWRELESELANDGISMENVVEHKTAIKMFLQDLLSDSATDDVSLFEVATVVKSAVPFPTMGNWDPSLQYSTRPTFVKNGLEVRVVSVVVMGLAGSGKSTFMSTVGMEQKPEMPGVQNLPLNHRHNNTNYEIHLVECSGFNDAYMPDFASMRDCIHSIYMQKHNFAGVLYMHDISATRMNKRHFLMLKTVFGDDMKHKCTIITTKWSNPETTRWFWRSATTLPQNLIRDSDLVNLEQEDWIQVERFDPKTRIRALEIVEPLLANSIVLNSRALGL